MDALALLPCWIVKQRWQVGLLLGRHSLPPAGAGAGERRRLRAEISSLFRTSDERSASHRFLLVHNSLSLI